MIYACFGQGGVNNKNGNNRIEAGIGNIVRGTEPKVPNTKYLQAWAQLMKRVASETSSDVQQTAKKKVRGQKEPFWTDSIKAEYVIEEEGFRRVKPYYFEYRTFAKERWLGRTVLEVFQKEFRDRSPEYYEEAVRHGMVTVNGEACSGDRVLKPSDALGHRIHRHEPPVTSFAIEIIKQTADMLVVNKPGSVPVHPSGRYRFNTLVEILKADLGLSHVSVINRLDRLTSGIVLMGLNAEKGEELHRRMVDRHFRKTYLCRVKGKFPGGVTECNEPLLSVEHKLGLVSVSPDGKEARTIFTNLRYLPDSDESIVKAEPLTGRTHQIRVHLQHLGHPISNDPLYNHVIWQRRQKEGPAFSLQEVAQQLLAETQFDEVPNNDVVDSKSLCPECEAPKADPTQLCIFLHAFRYAWDEETFQTSLPSWVPSDIAID